jgi:hypothetical protein
MKIVLQDGELEESLLLCFKGMVVLLGEKRNVRMRMWPSGKAPKTNKQKN